MPHWGWSEQGAMRRRWTLGMAVAAGLLALWSPLPGLAQGAQAPDAAIPAPAPAAKPAAKKEIQVDPDDPLRLLGIEVGVTDKNAAAARTKGIVQAHRQAYAALANVLTKRLGSAPPKASSDAEIGRLVRDFEIVSEQASGTRYRGIFNFRFSPGRVEERFGASALVAVAGEPTAAPAEEAKPAGPTLVVPLMADADGQLLLWSPQNSWRTVWGADPGMAGAVQLLTPLGDAEDLGAMPAEQVNGAAALQWAQLGQRYQAGEVVLVAYSESARGARVQVRRLVDGRERSSGRLLIPTAPEEPLATRLARARLAVIDAIAGGYAIKPVEAQMSVYTVTAPVARLEDLGAIRQRLGSIDGVAGVTVQGLSPGRARLGVRFEGDGTGLQQAAAGIGLALVADGAGFMLTLP